MFSKLQKIKYSKGSIKTAYGVMYRVYQHSPNAFFWETRKWGIWSTYPHACYDSAEDADQAARNCIRACAEGTRMF